MWLKFKISAASKGLGVAVGASVGVPDGTWVKVIVGEGVSEGKGVFVGVDDSVGDSRGWGEGVKVAVWVESRVDGALVGVSVWQALRMSNSKKIGKAYLLIIIVAP